MDSNTTGATDQLTLDGRPSKWEALTKSSGLSIKDQLDAGGSFGLGKHASFAVTDIRTVLYATAWQQNGQMEQRFQGKTILVSHVDQQGQLKRRTGYLGASNFIPLRNEEIPECYRLDSPGLAIHIPGYTPESAWQEKSIGTAIQNFFHAIVHRGVEIIVDGDSVTSATLRQWEYLSSDRTRGFIKASETEPVAETHIDGIGEVTLRLVKAAKNEHRGRFLALVRDAGMMITDVPRDMNLPGLKRFPSHWLGFYAILECRSRGEASVLRESEAPSHDKISTDQIGDPQRRRQARGALEELGWWCHARIREQVEPKSSDDVENASEVARFLGIHEEGSALNPPEGIELFASGVTEPQRRVRAPANIWSRHGTRTKTQTTGGKGKGNPPIHKGKGTGRKNTGTSTRDVPVAFSDIRAKNGTRHPTHSVVVTFDNPTETLRNIQLMMSVEDGHDIQVGIREAFVGSRKLTVKHNKVMSLPKSDDERCSIEFLTQVPVRNKGYYVTVGA